MNKTTFILLGVTYYIVSVLIIIVVLNKINKKEKNKYKQEIEELERDKNQIISSDIMSSLQTVEEFVNNDLMQEVYTNLKTRFDTIKKEDIPKITDMKEKFKSQKKPTRPELDNVEFDIYLVKAKSDYLLKEIKKITLSKGKNREIATSLKTRYRLVLNEYNNHKLEYTYISKPVELQFENIDKLFSNFEVSMEKNNYSEVNKIIKALDNMIGNLELVVKEAPSIILMGTKLIPRKMEDIKSIKDSMVRDGYNLDYLNIDKGIKEAKKTIATIITTYNNFNILFDKLNTELTSSILISLFLNFSIIIIPFYYYN